MKFERRNWDDEQALNGIDVLLKPAPFGWIRLADPDGTSRHQSAQFGARLRTPFEARLARVVLGIVGDQFAVAAIVTVQELFAGAAVAIETVIQVASVLDRAVRLHYDRHAAVALHAVLIFHIAGRTAGYVASLICFRAVKSRTLASLR